MKPGFAGKMISALVVVMCTTLIAGSGLAQEVVERAPADREPCFGMSRQSGLQALAATSSTHGGKAKIDLSQVNKLRDQRKCDYATVPRSTSVLASAEKSFSARKIEPKENPGASEVASPQGGQSGANEAQELAKKLSNPVASLISLPLQSNFDFGMGTGSGWRYTLNVQPVIPIKLSDKWNLISRTIIPIIHQGNVTGPNTSQSGLGDILQSFFFSPNKSEPFIWAVGPVALIPTATNNALGGEKWGLGPTALVLKQEHGWTYGMLANHVWSVAGDSTRANISSTFLQPFLSYGTKDAWTYSINTESTYDWNSNSWSVPINPLISKLVRFGKQPISFGGGLKCWVTTPNGGPEGCGLRIVVTALFPKK